MQRVRTIFIHIYIVQIRGRKLNKQLEINQSVSFTISLSWTALQWYKSIHRYAEQFVFYLSVLISFVLFCSQINIEQNYNLSYHQTLLIIVQKITPNNN